MLLLLLLLDWIQYSFYTLTKATWEQFSLKDFNKYSKNIFYQAKDYMCDVFI